MSDSKDDLQHYRKKSRSPCNQFLSSELYYVKKYFKSAAIDGIEHVSEGKSTLRRVVWALILFSSLVICVYFLVQHALEFADKPTLTTIRIVRPPEGQAFPAVTVCNLNAVSRSFARENNLTDFLSFYLVQSSFLETSREECVDYLQNIGLANSNLSFNDIFRKGASDDFVVSCDFATNRDSVSSDCIDSLQTVITDFGVCHTFNGLVDQPDTFFQLSGSRFGLRMILNISQNDYIAAKDIDAGVIVSVHSRHSYPELYEKGITIPPGKHARIGVSTKRLVDNSGKGACRSNDARHSAFPSVQYSPSGCVVNALYEYIASQDNCDCVSYRSFANAAVDERFASERNCTVADTCCITQASNVIHTNLDCPPPCDYTVFDASVSYSKFPHSTAAMEYSDFTGVDAESIDNDLVSFNVFFSDLYSEYGETVISYNANFFVADIGGTLGLFLGASIISLMELVILCADEIKGICCTSKKVRKNWDEFELKVLRKQRGNEEDQSTAATTGEDDKEKIEKTKTEEGRKERSPTAESIEEPQTKTSSV